MRRWRVRSSCPKNPSSFWVAGICVVVFISGSFRLIVATPVVTRCSIEAKRHLASFSIFLIRRCGTPARRPAVYSDDGQAQLLLEGPGEGAAHRVRLPAGGGADLFDGCAFGALQHPDHFGLLAVVAGARLGLRRSRVLVASAVAQRRFQFGIDFRYRRGDVRAFHAQGVVALGGDNQSVPSR